MNFSRAIVEAKHFFICRAAVLSLPVVHQYSVHAVLPSDAGTKPMNVCI
jgi:hypothetical protein